MLDPARDPNDIAFILVSVMNNCEWIILQKNHKNNYCLAHPLWRNPFNFLSKVTRYNVPPAHALELSQATCERTGFYARMIGQSMACFVVVCPKNNNTTINYNSENWMVRQQQWQLRQQKLNGNDGNDDNGENDLNEGDSDNRQRE